MREVVGVYCRHSSGGIIGVHDEPVYAVVDVVIKLLSQMQDLCIQTGFGTRRASVWLSSTVSICFQYVDIAWYTKHYSALHSIQEKQVNMTYHPPSHTLSYPIVPPSPHTNAPEFTPVCYMLLVSCSVLLPFDQRVVKQADD